MLGSAATLLGLQATIGLLVAKTLTSATVNPFMATNTTAWNPVLAFDVFNVQVRHPFVHSCLCYFLSRLTCWLFSCVPAWALPCLVLCAQGEHGITRCPHAACLPLNLPLNPAEPFALPCRPPPTRCCRTSSA